MSSFMQSSAFIHGLSRLNGKWELVQIIGEGTYGEVHKAVNKKQEYAAVKVVENHPSKLDELQNEMEILKRFSHHPNVVSYYGTYLFTDAQMQPTQIWLVMEYCEGRSVSELAKHVIRNNNRLDEGIIKYILHQTLQGIHYLHKNKVMHRDIKGPNILMTITGEVKIIDYGVSSELHNTMERRNTSVGSPFWMAPEVIACEQQLDYNYNIKCDVWSMGITAIELADGDPPYADEHPMKALFKIPRNPPPTVKKPEDWSPVFMDFLAQALIKDFEYRPKVDEMLQHEFLEDCKSTNEANRKLLMALIHINLKITEKIDKTSGTLEAKKRNAQKNAKVMEVDDLAKLPRLNEEIMLEYITERYNADQIYTYVGEILIACNPFTEMDIYGPGASMLYQNSRKDNLPPHIYMIASNAYHAMQHKQIDQCCVISGESGSGKTITANLLLKQYGQMGKSNPKLVKKILQINTLMEAFGNAQTTINQNSSRFGKFLELHFTSSGGFVGAQVSEYLLEKSRVVSQPTNERNFHIMYYLIAGLDFHNKLKDFELTTSDSHRYLNTDEWLLSEIACTSEMQVKFTEVQACLENIGFTKKEIQSFYCVLAAIIHLGDIEFSVDSRFSHQGEKSKVTNKNILETVSALLCVNKNKLEEALTINSSVTAGEIIKRNNTVDQALDCRDATAKVLYNRLFTWIVKRINSLLRAEDKTQTTHSRISILDMFGFENFEANSFEQLCINVANEQLQFYFNEYIFVWEFEEYATEGIKAVPFEFNNNKPILDLSLQKPVGILALLDEESRFPMATDMTLVEKYHDNIESPYLKTSRDTSSSFLIKHYAGDVKYDSTGFLEKNRDTLSVDVVETIQASSDETIAQLIEESAASLLGLEKHTDRKKSLVATTNRFHQTVSTHFRLSLRNLMSKVIKSDPHFVRCIRPNLQNKPNVIIPSMVLNQLRCTGVLETINIRQKGYSERLPFEQFVELYRFISYQYVDVVPRDKETCLQLLRASNIDPEETWGVGRTKIFLRYWHVQKLRTLKSHYNDSVELVQRAVRAWTSRCSIRKFLNFRHDAAKIIQSNWIRFKRKRDFEKLKQAMTDEVSNQRDLNQNTGEAEVRPFYRNYQRSEIGYTEDDSKAKRSSSFANDVLNQSTNGGAAVQQNDLDGIDPDGRAALEETRAIILLLQIELTCREAYDILDRTSYPVIHSIRNSNQGGESTPKLKPQKLNYREKQMAMVDGYSNPLQQKFRHAHVHTESQPTIQETSEEFHAAPMLGLVERPTRETAQYASPPATVSKSAPPVKPAPTKAEPTIKKKEKAPNTQNKAEKKKSSPPSSVNKKVDNYPSKTRRNSVPVKPVSIATTNRSKPPVEERKQPPSINKRVKPQQPPAKINTINKSKPVLVEKQTPRTKQPSNNSVNRVKPVADKENGGPVLKPANINRKPPPKSQDENIPRTGSSQRVKPVQQPTRKQNPPTFGSENRVMKERASYEDRIRRNTRKPDESLSRVNPSVSRNSSFAIPTSAPKDRQRLPTNAESVHRRFKQPLPSTNNHKPYNYLSNNRRDQSHLLNHAPIDGFNNNPINHMAYEGDQRKRASPVAKRVPKQNPPANAHVPTEYSRSNNPIHNFQTPNNGKKVLHGFHYGLQKESELSSMRLNRTGRLQQLVH
eukprot:TCONS_00069001-protein